MYASVEYLRGMGAEIEVLSPAEARSRFPQFRIADNQTCVYDGWGGYIESGRAVSIMARIAREKGTELRESILVSAVDELSSHVEVVHGGGRDRFDRVVVAAGCWVGRLLPEIGAGVKVSHQQMLLIVPVEPAAFAHGAMPCWSIDPDGEGWYGFPLLREGYVKISKEPLGDTVDPDIDREGTQDFADLRWRFCARGYRRWRRAGSPAAARACTRSHLTTTSWWTGRRAVPGSSSRAAAAATASSSAAPSALSSLTPWRISTTPWAIAFAWAPDSQEPTGPRNRLEASRARPPFLDPVDVESTGRRLTCAMQPKKENQP